MAANDAAIIGIEACGCITYANSRPDELDAEDKRAIARIVEEGGSIARTTIAGAQRRKNFLPSQCPHEPKGWRRCSP